MLAVFGRYDGTVVNRLRDVFFEEFARSDLPGMIFTYIWAFDQPADWAYIEHVKAIFAPCGTTFYYVELVADQAVRLARNATENRLLAKPSKRDVAASSQRLLAEDATHRLVSRPGEIPFPNYFRLDNTRLSPEEAAEQIQAHLGL